MLLSVCILLKDDGECLRRISATVQTLADEIVVVCDHPVSESIQSAAEQTGARVIPHLWKNDFAAARNSGLDAARGDWVFWIDADETLLGPDSATIRELPNRPDVLAYYVTIEDDIGSTTMSPRRHPSLYRRRDDLRYTGRIHEHFEPELPAQASRRGMVVSSSPIRLRHTGCRPETRPGKLQRNISLLELELADQPGQLYYLIELGRSLLLAGQSRGHAVLADAAKILAPLLHNPQPPMLLCAALLEYALSHAPADFPLSRSDAADAAARWFPSSPPLLFMTALWHYKNERYSEAGKLLQRLLEMGETGQYATDFSFDQRIFGDETRLNLGVCLARSGQIAEARKQFKRIKTESQFYAMAKANLERL